MYHLGLGITWSYSITTIKVKEVMTLREKEKGDGGRKENWGNYGIFILFQKKPLYEKRIHT